MGDNVQRKPFEILGKRLRKLRESRRETLAEVSGAVEIDIEHLARIESGDDRPEEEVLLLMANYFGLKDKDAERLWLMAGYGKHRDIDGDLSGKSQVIALAFDSRITYSDMSNVSINQNGVVLNFMQAQGLSDKPMFASRVGMSKEHAKQLLETLKFALEESEKPKRTLELPENTDSQA